MKPAKADWTEENGMRLGWNRLGSLAAVAAWMIVSASAAEAQSRVEVTRGQDGVAFGSCVPSLKAVNRTPTAIDFIEVTLSFALKSGESRTLEFRSRYREGIERAIAPGAMVELKVQPDLSRPLGVGCQDIVSIQVTDTVCEAQGKPCADPIAIDLGRR